MLDTGSYSPIHNDPNAYWCAGCWAWKYDCVHLVEPLTSPIMKLQHSVYIAATWEKNTLQVTMNTGERYQHCGVPRSVAIRFVRDPELRKAISHGYRFERVRGRVQIEWKPSERHL
jgi:hypothetical protein